MTTSMNCLQCGVSVEGASRPGRWTLMHHPLTGITQLCSEECRIKWLDILICPKCQGETDNCNDDEWCNECYRLYHSCYHCHELCVFDGVVGDKFFNDVSSVKLADLPDDADHSGLIIDDSMNYYANINTSEYFDLSDVKCMVEPCAYKWMCKRCNRSTWTGTD